MRIFDRVVSFCSRADPRVSASRVGRGVQVLLARGSARFDGPEASASPDRALAHALSWLGNELRGDAIPGRLRDAAGRLASFLDPQPDPSDRLAPSASETARVVALEDALAAEAARSAPERDVDAHGSAGTQEKAEQLAPELMHERTHGHDLSAGVCPFTGMRADGTLAAPASGVTSASGSTVEAPAPASPQPEPEPELRGSAREQDNELPAAGASVASSKRPTRARPAQKSKERLAGAQNVEKTSGRSATRSARKQPRSRTQASRKKA
jgi:hypothetical protein